MAEIGATAVTVPEAARAGEVVIVSIPEKSIVSLPPGLFEGTSDSVVVVDTGNYYPRQRDGRIEAIESGTAESRWVAQRLGRPVVKAFNNIFAEYLRNLGQPAGSPRRIALPVAGEDARAKAIVLRLIDEIGFDGVDAGGLDESWRQQPGTPVYCADFDAAGVRHALSEASRIDRRSGAQHRPPADRMLPSSSLALLALAMASCVHSQPGRVQPRQRFGRVRWRRRAGP